jgi:replicative DNA helicase
MSNWQPSSLSAEQALLGALIRGGANDKVLESIKPDDIFNPQVRRFYQAVVDTHEEGKAIDYMTVAEHLGDEDFTALGSIIKDTGSAANIYSYARIVSDKAQERSALDKLNEAMAIIRGEGKTQEKAAEAVTLVSDIVVDSNDSAPTHVKEIALEWLDSYEDRINNDSVKGLTTGIDGLDLIFGARGVGKTDMTVIGARPKVGKTQMMVKIGDHMARESNKPVLMFSMEMPGQQIFERFLTNSSKIQGNKFYEPMDDYEMSRVSLAIGELSGTNLYIDDRPNLSLAQIKSTCRKFKADHGEVAGFLVDYFTLMKIESAGRTDLAFGKNSTGLKDMAKELEIPVFLLAQLSRGVDSRPNKRPLISDLRESGSIEQDADRIIFLYRDSIYNPDSTLGGLTEVIVAANRHGAPGTAFVEMKGGWFENVSDNDVNRAYTDGWNDQD